MKIMFCINKNITKYGDIKKIFYVFIRYKNSYISYFEQIVEILKVPRNCLVFYILCNNAHNNYFDSCRNW